MHGRRGSAGASVRRRLVIKNSPICRKGAFGENDLIVTAPLPGHRLIAAKERKRPAGVEVAGDDYERHY